MNLSRSNRFASIIFLTAAFAITAVGQDSSQATQSRIPWAKETVDLFASLPIQDEGRIKPLDTFAAFKLLKLNGMRATTDLDGNRLTPMEWLLDCLFYPELAMQYKTFTVATWEAPEAIGISTKDKTRRDRYSFREIEPGQEKLVELATEYSKKEPKDRTAREQEIVNLANNFFDFLFLVHSLDYGREELPAKNTPGLAMLFRDVEKTTLSAVLSKAALIDQARVALQNESGTLDPAKIEQEKESLEVLKSAAENYATRARSLAFFPSTAPFTDLTIYVTPVEVVETVFHEGTNPKDQIAWMASMERLAQLRDDRSAFNEELRKLHTQLVGVAKAQGNYAKIPLEVIFYKSKVLFWSAWIFVACFLLITMYWFKPQLAPVPDWNHIGLTKRIALRFGRAVHKFAPLALLIPTALLITGITLRCIIRSRPPVSTLYETILFITACAVVVALVIEYINRKKVAISVAAVLGSLGMFIANRYEAKEGIDTMPSLEAVLDTNFWLSTHVTTVTLGYGAGLLAAAIAHVYIIGKILGFKRQEPAFFKAVYKMTYGVICFGLLFSVLGTVLGGIWANDSWGRFWGWDPKENGALMICLWELAMLHARMGGYIKDLGFCVTSVVGGMVVAFSWWGVNLLSVGLHSYGFTAGIFQYLVIFYGIESFIVLLGGAIWLRERLTRKEIVAIEQPAQPKNGKGKTKPGKKEAPAPADHTRKP
jgi:ABC-type transport system involved in cytochrome c biogenesis permease subunit